VSAHVTPALFTFLRDLKRHNDREWFAANRQRYVDDVEAPMLAFIADFGVRLRGISRCYVADARRMGGSMFRIYRDTRFSADKSPFKTHVAARFPHEARRKVESVPAFYLSLSVKECYGGGGVYHVARPALTKIRQHIVQAPKDWQAVLDSGLSVEGDRLTRAPAGFPATHPFVEDLKRKDLYSLTEFTERDVTSPEFLDRYTDACHRVAPLLEFLTKALGLRWS
jgi:uncharacterized protein (TIGR02453 family)